MKNASQTPRFTGYQIFVVAVLAFLQFTIILDFMILAPLGAILMPALGISASQFGLVVSAYAISAGVAGLITAVFADSFDRKSLLLFFYAGFILSTFLCGLTNSYVMLAVAHTATGFFGGVLGAIVYAITTDLFPLQVRGRVMGIIQTAFSGSQILGIPLGLYLASCWSWHEAFFMISAVGAIVGIVIWLYLRPIDAHLEESVNRSVVLHFAETVSSNANLLAFAATALMSAGGFMLMPFSSAFIVYNLGISVVRLPIVYLVGGISTIVIGPAVGYLSDKFGLFRMFAVGSILSVVMVLVFTHLTEASIWLVIGVNILMFAGIFSHMIPFQALVSAIPKPASRGSFMSISSSIQQFAGGFASILAGLIVTTSPIGAINHFDRLGIVVVMAMLGSLGLTYIIDLWQKAQRREQTADRLDVEPTVNISEVV